MEKLKVVNYFIIGLLCLYSVTVSKFAYLQKSEIEKLNEKISDLRSPEPVSMMTVSNTYTISTTKNHVIYFIDSLSNVVVRDCKLFDSLFKDVKIKHSGNIIYKCDE